jgi:hypothetical protein
MFEEIGCTYMYTRMYVCWLVYTKYNGIECYSVLCTSPRIFLYEGPIRPYFYELKI